MVKTVSKLLIIDASVARSSGEKDAKNHDSKYCREFLNGVLEICHKIVMTPEIRDEWQKHESNFALTWRSSMMQKKKIHILKDISLDHDLWNQVESVAENIAKNDHEAKQAIQNIMIKDMLLIEGAIATDKIIISLDEKVRTLFHQVPKISNIMWVNPAHPEEKALEWLEKGATIEAERLLGYKNEKGGIG